MVLTREIRDEIQNAVNTAFKQCINDQTFIKTIATSVSDAVTKTVNKKLAEIEQKLEQIINEQTQEKLELETKLNIQDDTIQKLKRENENLIRNIDFIEQETKKNCLRIFNFPEKNKENTKEEVVKLVTSKLSIGLTEEDIEICYRVGKLGVSNKPRSILLKMKSYDLRQKIYHTKKTLKGTGIIVREDLTRLRVELLNKIIEKTSVKHVWTEAGKIYVNHNNKICIIRNFGDYSKIFP